YRTVHRTIRRSRLNLEALEDRCLPSYSIIDLGSRVGGQISIAEAMNDAGQVTFVAYPQGARVGYIWDSATGVQNLGSLGGGLTDTAAINNLGQIVGGTYGADGTWHSFLLTPEDTNGDGRPDCWFRDDNFDGANDLMTDIGSLSPNDINDAGVV